MSLRLERFAALVDRLDKSVEWHHVVPGAERPWSKVAELGHYDGSWHPPLIRVGRADILVNRLVHNAAAPVMTVPTTGAQGRVQTQFDGRQDLWLERDHINGYKRTVEEAQWILDGREAGPAGHIFVIFHAATQKTSAANRLSARASAASEYLLAPRDVPPPEELPWHAPPPPDYASTAYVLPEAAPPAVAPPRALADRVMSFLEQEDASVRFRGKGLKSQEIDMRTGFVSVPHASGHPRRALEVLVRLKGVWRPIELDGEPAHAFLLPGGDCDRAGEVVECGVTEPSRAFPTPWQPPPPRPTRGLSTPASSTTCTGSSRRGGGCRERGRGGWNRLASG
ncbi:hypothetical protein DMC30DRAFT_190363 [Rhodotorula diobovata]|uniref:Uncharacterized protein n=1 Tax=Rhodotorula diobovata TaxID=5288 RepID=A0A5C5G6I1_9BASI|nr:hypothetical protein DMC30DRAFT_190363 [Rhodotorula diobovata]